MSARYPSMSPLTSAAFASADRFSIAATSGFGSPPLARPNAPSATADRDNSFQFMGTSGGRILATRSRRASGTRLAAGVSPMGFTLRKNESAAAGLRRIAEEEIDTALELLAHARTNPEEKVHELRKQFKKI